MRAIAKVDVQGLQPGDLCGFGSFGKYSAQLSVAAAAVGHRSVRMQVTDSTQDGPQTEVRVPSLAIDAPTMWLRVDLDFETDLGRFAYSIDNRQWRDVGTPFPLAFDWRTGTFQGQQIALSCYNSGPDGGYMDIDSVTVSPLVETVHP